MHHKGESVCVIKLLVSLQFMTNKPIAYFVPTLLYHRWVNILLYILFFHPFPWWKVEHGIGWKFWYMLEIFYLCWVLTYSKFPPSVRWTSQNLKALTTNIVHGLISLTQKFSLTTKLYNDLYSFSFCYAFFILTLGP
jgi:hypothetical protein